MEEAELRTLLRETAEKALATRKGVASCLEEKNRRAIELGPPTNGTIDSSVWNDLGRFFFSSRMYEEAEIVYNDMLKTVKRLESGQLRIHKGLPLYNLGISQIGLRNFDEGIPNVLRAFDEDKRTLGARNARNALASHLKDDLVGFVSLGVDDEYLRRFNRHSRPRVAKTADLLSNMDDVEQLLFTKIMTAKRKTGFQRDMYTQILLHDNLRNLCILLESNLKRRLHRGGALSGAVANAFIGERWIASYRFETSRRERGLAGYDGISDFNAKIRRIRNHTPLSNPQDDFHLQNFLTATLVRNLTAHVLGGPITVLRNLRDYDGTFARITWSLLYSLNYNVH